MSLTAQAADNTPAKEAFQSAKELGTIEAWEAFLQNFPKGFHADLARAYVKRLGSSGGTSAASTHPASSPPPQAQPASSSAPLELIDFGIGTDAWRNRNTVMATAGNQSVYAASVHSNGLDLVTYCVDLSRVGGVGYGLYTVIRENPPGGFPQFSERIKQGLAKAPRFDAHHRKATVSFPGGGVHPGMTARVRMDRGELLIGSGGRAFSQGAGFDDMLSGQSMTVSLPPFQATFQLTNSRTAICAVADRCGASFAGCGSSTYATAPPAKTKSVRKRCGKGYYLKRGRCKRYKKRKAKKKTFTCSAGKTWNGSQCVQNPYLTKKGKPLDGYIVDQDGNVYQDNGGGE